jgi:hypothetical protein
MRPAIHTTANVLPGNKIEVSSPELPEGQTVDVIVVLPESDTSKGRDVMEVLRGLPPGPRSAPTWDEVERLFREERDAWER